MKALYFRGKPLEHEASQVCVLYDPRDGRVVHVHGSTAVRKELACTKAQLEERTLHHAKAFGHSVAGLKTLHVPLSAIRQRGTMKVDEESQTLVVSSPPPASMKELLATHRKGKAKIGG